MRINTNVSALNAYRNLSETNNAVSSSMQKLSSGFRINRAADDAAGLGIANRLRADTRAMSQASKNADQANSVLQIAEGATSTIQKMLERMKELATQAGSDSVDAAGRTRIQEEFSQLQEEITRTVDTTKFQGGHLLKTVAASPAVPGTPMIPGTPAVPASTFDGSQSMTADAGNDAGGTGSISLDGVYDGAADATITVSYDGTDYSYSVSGGGATGTFSGSTAVVNGITLDVSGLAGTAAGDEWTMDVTAAVAGTPDTPAVPDQPAVEASGGPRSFLVGSSEQYTSADTITVAAIDLTLNALNLEAADADLTSVDNARAALTAIDAAMETVSTTLGDIGATQNRIEFAQQNLKTSIQNFSAAESVIRDLDMAEEMTKFSKNNILAQAGTAMLAQANQSAQGVLQLLRG